MVFGWVFDVVVVVVVLGVGYGGFYVWLGWGCFLVGVVVFVIVVEVGL